MFKFSGYIFAGSSFPFIAQEFNIPANCTLTYIKLIGYLSLIIPFKVKFSDT